MTTDHRKSAERIKGFYETPDKTVEYMWKKVLHSLTNDSKILDPAVGKGVFLKKLVELGVDKKQLYGHDSDPQIIDELKNGFNVLLKDSLLDEYPNYDRIIGNPPYNSNECDYIKKNRALLKTEFHPIGAINLYPLFIFSGIRHLNEGGILCMIVLDSFLTNIYYRLLREHILNTCKIKEILLAPWRLFHPQRADVRTAIITLEKCSGPGNVVSRNTNQMTLIDRVANEDEYFTPTKIQKIKQIEFSKTPHSLFYVGTVDTIIRLVKNHKFRIDDIAEGGTGISTGNDKRFLRDESGVKGNPNWVGFYQSGKRAPYFYETKHFIERNWQDNARKSKTFMIRNSKYFFREGITCSSVGLKFNASYLPPGNLFGVNTNLFTKTKENMYFLLGLLNSKVALYILRQVIDRTNNISARYVKMMPLVEPTPKQKQKVVKIVKNIVENKMKDQSYDFSQEQKILDEIFFMIYKIPQEELAIINDFCANLYERI